MDIDIARDVGIQLHAAGPSCQTSRAVLVTRCTGPLNDQRPNEQQSTTHALSACPIPRGRHYIKLDANIQCIYHSILIHISCIYQSTRGRTSTRRQECTRRAHIRRHRNSLSSRCNLCPSTCKSAAQTSQQPRHIAHRCALLTERVCVVYWYSYALSAVGGAAACALQDGLGLGH